MHSNQRWKKIKKEHMKYYYNISTKHFTSKAPKRDWTDDDIFCEDSKASQPTLRRAFKKKEDIPYKCAVCGLEPLWNSKPLVLTLDHINGRNRDNQISNLRWVCPNCDRQLDTYGFKNKKDLQKGIVLFSGNYATEDNNADVQNQKQQHVKKSIETPDRQELKEKLWEHKNYTQVANDYNVSPTQIRRWCRQYDLPATINIVKHTSEYGWESENWNDFYKPNVVKEQSKPCYMIDMNTNEIIKEFSSRAEAARYLGLDRTASAHIGSVCDGHRKSAYGYKWKDKN